MPEFETPKQVVSVDYICDKCGEGTMVFEGIILMSYPPRYPHICNSCSHSQTFKVKYPTIVYK